MKKLSMLAAAAALAMASAAPAVAEEKTQDPFVSTQGLGIPPIVAVIGTFGILAIVAGSTESSSGT